MGRKKKNRGAKFAEGERVLNFAPRACEENGGVAPEGERSERCQRQMKRGERVAAVGALRKHAGGMFLVPITAAMPPQHPSGIAKHPLSSARRKAAWKFWAPQQGSVRIDRRVRLMGAVDV